MFSAKKLRLPVLALMMALLTLSSCGWFGGGTRSAPEVDDATANPLMPDASGGGLNFGRPEAPDPSVRIATVDSLTVERTPTGAIVVATGTATRQGAFDAALRNPSGEPQVENGVLLLEFIVTYPPQATSVGPAQTRQVRAAASLTTQTLRQIRAVRVIAMENSREARRR